MSNVLFRSHNALQLIKLFSSQPEARTENYKRGEIISHSFTGPENVYIIKSGFAKGYTIENTGSLKLQYMYATGEIFPVSCLIGMDSKAPVSDFEAMTDCTVVKLPRAILRRIQRERPAVAQTLLEQIAKQFVLGMVWAHAFTFKHTHERVAYRLLYMARRFGEKGEGGTILLPDFNQVQFAEFLNLTRESVNRELRRLERSGAISGSHGRIAILKSQALCKSGGINPGDYFLYWTANNSTVDISIHT